MPQGVKTIEVKPCEIYSGDEELNSTVDEYNDLENLENPNAVGSLINKRNGIIHHCSCPTMVSTFVIKQFYTKDYTLFLLCTQNEPVDFGLDVYPRYHSRKSCDWNLIKKSLNHCKTGLKCKEHFHKFRVLKIKPQDHVVDKYETLLPHELRQKYFMDSKNISIDCRCSY